MKVLILILLALGFSGCSVVYIMADCDRLNETRYYKCHEKVAPVIEWVGEKDGVE